jgi:lipoyl(octanoyl) transferase
VDEVRLLPLETADGAYNMAADEAMLQSAVAGQASLRFYTWTPATLSLGYFQPAASRLADPLLASLPFVRRPSGGQALVHHFELTYAWAVPRDMLRGSKAAWVEGMHDLIRSVFNCRGIALQRATAERRDPTTILCFRQIAPGDLLAGDAKVMGSSQRVHRQCLLQHGGILLARSPHTPSLPGIREQSGRDISPSWVREAIVDSLAQPGGWRLVDATWTPAEQTLIERLVQEKYATAKWNEKR